MSGEPSALSGVPTPMKALVDRHFSGLELADLLGIDVHAGDLVAGLGEAGSGDESDVSSPDDGDLHGVPPLGPRGGTV